MFITPTSSSSSSSVGGDPELGDDSDDDIHDSDAGVNDYNDDNDDNYDDENAMTGDSSSSSSSSSVGWDPELGDESDDDHVHDNDAGVSDYNDDNDDNYDEDDDDDDDRRGGRRSRRRLADADAAPSSSTTTTIPSVIGNDDDDYDHSSSDDDGGGGGGEMMMSSHTTRDDDNDNDYHDDDEKEVGSSGGRRSSRDDGHGCPPPPYASLRYDMLGAPTLLRRLCPSSYLLEWTRGGERDREGMVDATTNKEDDDDVKCVKVGRSNRGKITGFHVFRAEYLRDNPISPSDANDRNAKKMRLMTCSATWKDMSKEGKLKFKDKAEAQNNIAVVEAEKAAAAAAVEGVSGDPPPRKSRRSGFNVFRSDYHKIWNRSNPNASLAERNYSMITVCREAGAQWKCMSDAEKSVYKDRAAMENAGTVLKRKRTGHEKKSPKGGINQTRIIQNGAYAVDGRDYATKDHERTSDDRMEDVTDVSCDDINSIGGDNGVIGENECDEGTLSRPQNVDDGRGDGGYVKSEYELLRERNIARNNARLLELGLLLPAPPPSEDRNRNRSRDRARIDSGGRARSTTAKRGGEGACRAIPTRRSTRLTVLPSGHPVSGSTANISSGSVGDDHNSIGRGKCSRIEDEVDADQERGIIFGSAENTSSRSDSENRFREDGPTKYGNCIIGFNCHCQYCISRPPASFIVHPTGDDLSSLAISRLSLPRRPPRRCDQHKQVVVGVGSRILQISRCGSATRSMDSSYRFCIVARTSQYCSVIYAKSTTTSLDAEEECSIEYNLREETRIDMCSSPCRSINPSYLPVYLSCDPKATDLSFTFPTFAILSRDCAGNSTTIHRVVLKRGPVVKCHSISSSLSDISLIEFCSDNRMEVWAAARSRSTPKLSAGLFKGGTGIPVTGYGHSLFRIDLRDDSSSLVWSPSHAEFLTEGLHSINGIKSDATTEHLLWVSSSSACKVWALDVRHKLAKIVVSWSLPLLSDDFGSQSALTGIYGGGVLMSQPIPPSSSKIRNNSIQIHSPPMFSLKKDSNSNALCLYQFPCANPRLGTRSLESVGFQYIPKSHYEVSSIARSAIFPLPDVGGRIFNVGLVAFHNSSKTCLNANQLSQLCSQTTPVNVIYVITMTNIGDLYSHSLLEFNGAEETLARQYRGLPAGSKVISVPLDMEAKPPDTGQLTVSLSNEFPIPSSAISPYIVREAGDCCTFKTYDVGDILSRKSRTNSSLQEFGRLDDWVASDSVADETPVSKAHCNMHDSVDSNTATNEATFNNSSTDSLRLTSHGLHKSELIGVSVRYSIKHSPPKFGVVSSSELSNPSSKVIHRLAAATVRHSQRISEPFSQTVRSVDDEERRGGQMDLTYKDQDETEYDTGHTRVISAPDKRKKSEIDVGLIAALKSSYYFKEKANQNKHVGVKSEWDSDNE